MHYKAPDNSLHFLEDDSFVHLLPAGSVAITPEEAEAIRIANTPAPIPPSPQQQIDAIEDKTKMNRAVREFLLESTVRETMRDYASQLPTDKAEARAIVEAQLYAGNPAYKRVKDIDNQIVALRALL